MPLDQLINDIQNRKILANYIFQIKRILLNENMIQFDLDYLLYVYGECLKRLGTMVK